MIVCGYPHQHAPPPPGRAAALVTSHELEAIPQIGRVIIVQGVSVLPKGGAVYHLWNVLAGGSSLYILGVSTRVYLVAVTICGIILAPQLAKDNGPVLAK